MLTGKILFRDLGGRHGDKRQFVLVGQVWVPGNVPIQTEHTYPLLGSAYTHEVSGLVLGVHILTNGAVDVSKEARKKNVAQLVPLIYCEAP